MKIIKPRAWDRMNKKFVTYYSILFYRNQPTTLCVSNGNKACIRSVNEFDLEFSTGILDSKKREIYEGDIVNCHDVECDNHSQDVKATVIWDYGAFFLKFPEGTYADSQDNIQYLSEVRLEPYTTLEVVGNIYDNPELLKGKEV